MQPPQALAPIAYVLDVDAQVRAFAVVLQRIHDEAGVKVVGSDPIHKGLAHANANGHLTALISNLLIA